ncbi:MAG: heptosyltransferase II [archaeon GW2011_AR4]|nr:MAG: heptosyltransferase II [archaeon GW2011_AR4]
MLRLFLSGKKCPLPKSPGTVLISRSGGLGDIIMTTPLVRAIRNHYPKAHIVYLVGLEAAPALKNNKDINKIIAFDEKIIFGKKIGKILELKQKIMALDADMCFILDKSKWWNVLMKLSGIPVRVGFDRKGEGFSNTHNIAFDGEKSELEYYLEMADLIGARIPSKATVFNLKEDDHRYARSFLHEHSLDRKKVLAICPGGAKNCGHAFPLKRWLVERYAELINELPTAIEVVIIGGPMDKEIIDEMKGMLKRRAYISYDASLSENAALLAHCRLVLTHDSGLMHIAAALNDNVIALFGPTPALRFAPSNVKVIDKHEEYPPCYDIFGNTSACQGYEGMNALSAGEVQKVVLKKLDTQ